MTTQNSYPEHSDVDTSVVEDAHVSETTASSPSASVDAPIGEETFTPSSATETPSTFAEDEVAANPQHEQEGTAFTGVQAEGPEGQDAARQSDGVTTDEANSDHTGVAPDEVTDTDSIVEFAAEIVAETSAISSDEANTPEDFAYTGGIPVVEEEVRPFTEMIEAFRQAESRFSAALEEARAEAGSSETLETPVASSAVEEVFVPEFTVPWNAPQTDVAPTVATAVETETPIAETTGAVDAKNAENAENAPQTTTVAQTPRPVSPLLRPATRLRVPRHTARQRDEARAAQAAQAQPVQPVQSASAQQPVEAKAEPVTPTAESAPAATVAETTETAPVEPPRPARRYRFDRPAPTTPPVTPTTPATPATPAVPTRNENSQANGDGNGHNGHNGQHGRSQTLDREVSQQPEQNTARAIAPEPAVEKTTEPAQTTQPAQTTSVEPERRRKHGQERQRGKEHGASQAVSAQEAPVVTHQQQQPAPMEIADVAALVNAQPPVETPVGQSEEVAPEDLPPLEYADLQKASTRRRRRRHTNGASVAALTGNTPSATGPTPIAPTVQSAPTKPGSSETPAASVAPTAVPQRPAATPPVAPTTANGGQYGITSGYTVSQMNNGNENRGPFMGPEPSPARGTMAAQNVRSIRTDAQRTPAYPVRSTEATSASVNQLANIVAQAIQTQTDRMIAELRRSNQAPTNISVSMPPFPSTERVGVFVDVANLLYSARTLRMTVDFGKLLDFLRGNRRLVRAQAYCPTSPQPGDEQMFLQAVKGLGYRITTKNYKTFSSGAKKADLDLDLCMDVVRLVDGRAVDCIVLVSGDSDFMPMLDYCSDHGVRVEVAAFDEAMSATLRQSCDLFINLSMLDEIRA